MEGVVERGTATDGADSRLHDRGQDRHGGEARERPLLAPGVQRVVCRLHSVAQSGARDHRRHRLAARGAEHRRRRCPRRSSSASPKRRCSTSASRRRSIRAAPVLVARRSDGSAWRRRRRRRRRRRSSASSPTARRHGAGPAAAERARRDAEARQARADARLTGDGFVVSQDPPAGVAARQPARIVPAAFCERQPARRHARTRAAMTWAELHGVLAGARPHRRRRCAARRRRGRRRHRRRVRLARRSTPGQVFVALKGQHADGAAFARAGDRARRGRDRVGAAGARRTSHVPWIDRRRRAAGAGRARGGVLPASRASEMRVDRHHRHQRQDDDRVSHRRRSSKPPACGAACSARSATAIGDEVREATRTTPEAPDVQALLREMVDRGCGACAMEVSSHALSLQPRGRDVRSPPASSRT